MKKYNDTLLLYSTSGCHLCEIAINLIDGALLEYRFNLQIIDIANEDVLFEKYGVRIPVIKFKHSDQELGWPFDYHELTSFLDQFSCAATNP